MEKKLRKIFSITLAVLLLFTGYTAFAKVTYLWRATSTTYVTSEHGDSYFADTYYGTASVRGADRVRRDGRIYGYDWVSITYDVQGDEYKTRADSYGRDNPNQIIRNITVKDKWNNGPKTTVQYNYRNYVAAEHYSSPVDLSDTVIEGGEYFEGQATETAGEVINEGIDKSAYRFGR